MGISSECNDSVYLSQYLTTRTRTRTIKLIDRDARGEKNLKLKLNFYIKNIDAKTRRHSYRNIAVYVELKSCLHVLVVTLVLQKSTQSSQI